MTILIVAATLATCALFASTSSAILKEECRGIGDCGDLGCYMPEDEGVDYSIPPGGTKDDIRPRSLIPNCRLADHILLRLNTRRNKQETDVLNPNLPESIRQSRFDPSQKTKIMIHGFLDRYMSEGWKTNKDKLLEDGDHNVIRVDWGSGNQAPYFQAVANLRLVGAYVAKFINVLVSQHGVKPEDIHIIGHSLGAHGAGYAGAICQTKYNFIIGRITGLDPAGLYFGYLPANVRLDSSDAKVVDTIVTNGLAGILAFGSTQAMGHLNFFPNGGQQQPGCTAAVLSERLGTVAKERNVFDRLWDTAVAESGRVLRDALSFKLDLEATTTALDTFGCSHNYAVHLFAGTIVNDHCMMKSYQCSSWQAFLAADPVCAACDEKKPCSPMGYRANLELAEPGKVKNFYTATVRDDPFCAKLRLQFTVKNGTKNEKTSDPVNGKVYIKIYGDRGTSEMISIVKNPSDFYMGHTYQYFPEITRELGELQKITISWKANKGLLGNLNPLAMTKKDNLNLAGDILLIDVNGLVSVFTPRKSQIASGEEVTAELVETRDL